ncbi:MAG: hypothetical protein ACRC5A_06750 [Enterobacteriaceae bacterium]
MIWLIALRNLVKNGRRSFMTIISIGMGGLAMLLFGGFVTSVYFGVQTSMIQEQGQLHIYQQGYLKYGAADPDNYSINDYQAVSDLLLGDPELKRQIAIITPQITLAGIAGVVASDNSKTFLGRGVWPADADKMRTWDGWNVRVSALPTGLRQDRHDDAVVGLGMARLLGLCKPLNIADCEGPPLRKKALSSDQIDVSGLLSSEDQRQLSQQDNQENNPQVKCSGIGWRRDCNGW